MDNNRKYLDEYLDHLKNILFFSSNTIRAYSQDINQFFDYIKENKLKVNKDNIRDFISDVFLRSKNKATIARKIYAIRSFYAFLLTKGKADKNPFDGIRTPKIDKKSFGAGNASFGSYMIQISIENQEVIELRELDETGNAKRFDCKTVEYNV